MKLEGLVCNVIAYIALIGQAARASLSALQFDEADSLECNVITYIALIGACGQGKQPEHASDFFKVIKLGGLMCNVSTYIVLISASKKL